MGVIKDQRHYSSNLNRNYYIYMHIVPNGKRYVGITENKPEVRWDNGNGYSQHDEFYDDIKKYGWKNIVHVVLYSGLNKKEAMLKENELILQHDLLNPQNGYNKKLNNIEQNENDIDDMCNKEPYTTTLRISGELRNQLKRIAKIEHKTLNGLITKILIEAVTNYNLYR